MASKKVTVDIDVKSGSVKIANQETLNLQQQIKILTAELRKTAVGTAEFELLSETLKDNRDKMELVNAKSKDLFQSFGQIPGPIGDIGFGLDDTVGKLKVFSAFNLKDIKGQFKALGGDFVEIGKNLSQVTGLSKLFNATSTLTAKALNGVGISANASSKGIKLFSGALVATGIGAIVVGLGLLISNFDKVRDAVYKMFPPLKMLGDAIGNVINFFTDLIGVTSEAERAEAKRQETYKKAAAATEVFNQGIQREINLLKAQGASQDEIDKKRKQAIQNQLNDLKIAANERGTLYGEQAKQYKDLQNELQVIDAEATKRNQEETDKKNKESQQKAQQAADKSKQQQREFLQSQADAQVQLIKDQEDTVEAELRSALERQYALKNQGKTLSVEVQKQQAAEIDKIVKEEVQKDKETRQKAFDERIKMMTNADKMELELAKGKSEALKIEYGETSTEYRKSVDAIFQTQQDSIVKERQLLEEQKKTRDGLTNEQIERLKQLVIEEQNVTNAKAAENKKRIQDDVATFLKAKEEEKAAREAKFAQDMELAATDFDLQQEILNKKIEQDNAFYSSLLANEKLTAEERKKIQDEQTKNADANAKAQIDIETKKFQAQQALLGATANALSTLADMVGKDTAAGKSLAVAASLINTYSAIAGQLKAFSGLPVPGYAIAQAIATGLVGFKAVKDIVSTPVPNGGGGGGSTPAPQVRQLAIGGFVSGPGTGTSDSIPAYLSNGESVINAQSTRMFRPLLSTINQIGGGRRFAEGGVVSPNQAMDELNMALANSASQPIKTYVVAQDMTSMQMFDRAAKSRSTL